MLVAADDTKGNNKVNAVVGQQCFKTPNRVVGGHCGFGQPPLKIIAVLVGDYSKQVSRIGADLGIVRIRRTADHKAVLDVIAL